VQGHRLQPVGDNAVRPGKEACTDAVGDIAEAQIEARRLDLIGIYRPRHRNDAFASSSRIASAGSIPGVSFAAMGKALSQAAIDAKFGYAYYGIHPVVI
jgi:hypothetical protein